MRRLFLLLMSLNANAFNLLNKVTVSHDVGKEIIKGIAEGLPMADKVGHQILAVDNAFIQTVLSNEHMSHEVQKKLIMMVVKISMIGDEFGSHMLHSFYDMIDKLL